MAVTCSCGCGEPVPTPPRGGYNSRIRETVWFASNRCAAQFETDLLRLSAELRQAPTLVQVQLFPRPRRDDGTTTGAVE